MTYSSLDVQAEILDHACMQDFMVIVTAKKYEGQQ